MYNLDLEQRQLQRKMQKLGEMLVSLEAYQQLAKGGLTRQASVVVAQDLLRVAKLIEDTDTVSIEEFAKLDHALSHAIAMEDASSIAAKIGAAITRFKEWLKKAYEFIKEQVGALMVSFTKLRTRVDEYKTKVKTVGEQTVEVHIPAKLANQVAIQGDMNQGHFPELRGLANFGAVAYPEAINEFYMELAAVVKNFDPAHEASDMVAAIEGALKPLNFSNDDTQTYPGNVMIVQDDDGYNYSIASIDARVIGEDVQRKSRTGAELTHDLMELSKVIDIAEKLQDVSSKVETSVSKVLDATDALVNKASKGDEDSKANASSMITTVLNTTARVKNNNASIVRYLGRVIEAHLQIMDLEIKTATNNQRA